MISGLTFIGQVYMDWPAQPTDGALFYGDRSTTPWGGDGDNLGTLGIEVGGSSLPITYVLVSIDPAMGIETYNFRVSIP